MTSTPTPAQGPSAQEPTEQEPTAQERLAWMGKNSKKLIITLVVLIVAGIVVVFSFSLFSSSSANPGNLAASGIMAQDNSQEGLAILTVSELLPGESGTGTVSITNVGDADGNFSLTASDLVDTPATPAFSDVLNLVVTDGTTEIYNGALGAITTLDLGTWAPGEQHDFTFTVTFDAASGNEYQDAETTLDLTWDATQDTN